MEEKMDSKAFSPFSFDKHATLALPSPIFFLFEVFSIRTKTFFRFLLYSWSRKVTDGLFLLFFSFFPALLRKERGVCTELFAFFFLFLPFLLRSRLKFPFCKHQDWGSNGELSFFFPAPPLFPFDDSPSLFLFIESKGLGWRFETALLLSPFFPPHVGYVLLIPPPFPPLFLRAGSYNVELEESVDFLPFFSLSSSWPMATVVLRTFFFDMIE